MNDKVFIIIKTTTLGIVIESVWTTFELAQSAIYWHAQSEMCSVGYFSIIVRELNKTVKQ